MEGSHQIVNDNFLKDKIILNFKKQITKQKELQPKVKFEYNRRKTTCTFAQRAISTTSIPTTFGSRSSTSLHMFKMQSSSRFLDRKKIQNQNNLTL